MVGSLAHTVAARYLVSHQLECLHLSEEDDAEAITERLVDFLLSGWTALDTPAQASEDREA